MKSHLVAVMLLALSSFSYGADQCNLQKFPDFWADAQDLVASLKVTLAKAEKEHPYSQTTVNSFKKSLGVCAAQAKAGFGGNGGSLTQSKCEAVLICSRLWVLEQ